MIATTLRKAKTHANAVIKALASLKLAVTLLVVLAVVIVGASVLATKHGHEYSQWFVYHTLWFVALLILLSMSVFSAAYVRFPWKRHQIGFVITHAGLLMLLVGSLLTIWLGLQGQVVLCEGASTDQFLLNQRSQVTASWIERPHEPAYVFTFESGPADWKSGTKLDIGSVDGMKVRVLNYYQRSEPVERWVRDDAKHGGPLVRFQLEGPQDSGRIEHFLADQDYGAEVFVGPIAIRLQRAISDAMLADFLNPPKSELGEKGTLTIYYEDEVQRASVDQYVGQAIDVGDSGAKVELVQYFGNAKLNAAGQFQPVGEDLRNPLVELKINLPGDDRPYRQVAFAKSPLLNFDGVYERECPVKFVYEHPKLERTTAIEFLQACDGKLYARTISGTNCASHGEVTAGSRFDIQGGFVFTVTEYLPHTRREISFKQAIRNTLKAPRHESAAAEVEVAVAGESDTLWLQRNHPEFQSGTINTDDGLLRVQFTTAQIPLGFSLELIDFQGEINPSGDGNAACSSLVRVIDRERGVNDERLVSMSQPLSHKGYRFYQSRFREAAHGKETSTLRVVYDPSRALKYAGSLGVCLGIATMFCMRAYSGSRTIAPVGARAQAA